MMTVGITPVYRLGSVTVTDQDERRAYLHAFGRNLKVQRVRCGLTQEQLAARAGLHRTFIGVLERGEGGINIVELVPLAAALGVTARELIPERAALD
jgi:transcriptional regulator with XRE-family HTH domain